MTARPDRLHIVADQSPGLHRTDSDAIVWWLPLLGPTSSWLAVLLARQVASSRRAEFDPALLARTVGVAPSKLWASLDRLDTFGVARFLATDTLAVRLHLPRLEAPLLGRLPAPLAHTYPPSSRVNGQV